MKFFHWAWKHLEEFLAGICLTVIVLIISINVFLRYVFNSPIDWVSEVATILFVWMVMLGIGAAARYRLHPSIDVIVRLFPGKIRSLIEILMNIFVCYLLIDFTLRGWKFAWVLGLKKFTGMLELPYTVVYLAIPIGFGLMFVRFLTCFIEDLRMLKNRKKSGDSIKDSGNKVEEVI